MAEDAPIACTLNDATLADRLDWIAQFRRRALLDSRREPLALHMTFDRAERAGVERLIAQEQDCCGFLDFELSEVETGLRLVIRVPERAAEIADTIFDQFAPRA